MLKEEAARIIVTTIWTLCSLVKTLDYKRISVEGSVSLEMIIIAAFRKTMDTRMIQQKIMQETNV